MEGGRKLGEVRATRREAEDVKLRNIVDMALGFSAMMRLFERGPKEKIQDKILELLPALFTGMRRSELLGLKWGDVNLIPGQIYVSRGLHHLKNGSYIFYRAEICQKPAHNSAAAHGDTTTQETP